MMKVIFTLLLFLTACTGKKEIDPYEQALLDHAEEQKKRYGLEIVAAGVSQNRFAVHYLSGHALKIPEVRRLFVFTLEDFLTLANTLQAANNLPLVSLQNLAFCIGFITFDGDLRDPPDVAYVFLKENQICYCYHDALFGKFTEYKDVEEPYEEAKRIVQAERRKIQ